MSTPNLLPAPEIIDAEHADNPQDLLERIDSLEKEVSGLRSEMDRNMRQISDLLRTARVTFGTSATATSTASGPVESDKWERLKAKLGGKMAEIIEALQLTGSATRTQLKNQTGGALGTIDQAVYKLRDMGLLVKNGDGWSLKP